MRCWRRGGKDLNFVILKESCEYLDSCGIVLLLIVIVKSVAECDSSSCPNYALV